MSDTMLVGGDGEEPPRKEGVAMAPGLGFLTSTVVDQHFAQRGRLNRLLTALAHNPGNLGLGIDENTAVVIKDNALLEVVGEQGVMLLDGRSIRPGGCFRAGARPGSGHYPRHPSCSGSWLQV
jgi:cyanophycinase